MRSTIRGLAKRMLFDAGHYSRALAERRFPGIAVLCYHAVLPAAHPRTDVPFEQLHVGADVFASHCKLIAAHCNPVSLAKAEKIWRGEIQSPPRPVLVTFDDGHHAFVREAMPSLRANRVPATVFICTEPVTSRMSFWFDSMARFHGEGAVEDAKALTYPAWRLRIDASGTLAGVGDPIAPLSRDDVATLVADPLITLGAHTMTHPILAQAQRAIQHAEIAGSIAAVRAWTNAAPVAFAYPNGRPNIDYNYDTLTEIAESGVTSAFTTATGWATRDESPFERSRFMMLADIDAAELAHRLCYSWA